MFCLNRLLLQSKPKLGLRSLQLFQNIAPSALHRPGCVASAYRSTTFPKYTSLSHLNPIANVTHSKYPNSVFQMKVSLRSLHHTTRNMMFDSRDPFKRDPFKNGRLFFSVSPLAIAFSVLFISGFIAMFFLVIPILFSLFLPLALLAIVVYQFRSYKTRKVMRLLNSALDQTTMKLSFTTRRELFLKKLFFNLKPLSELKEFEGSPFQPMKEYASKYRSGEFPNADRFISFLKSRLDEGLRSNEHNLRTILMGKDVNYDPDAFELKTDSYSMTTSSGSESNTLYFSFFLFGTGSEGVRRPVGIVYVVTNERPGNVSFSFTDDSADSTELSPMVIYVRTLGPFSKNCFITDVGETSANAQYSVRRRSDGGKEYTFKK